LRAKRPAVSGWLRGLEGAGLLKYEKKPYKSTGKARWKIQVVISCISVGQP